MDDDERRGGSPVAPDFGLLFGAIPSACMVLEPDLTIVAATDAYLRTARTTRRSLVGKKLVAAPADGDARDDATSQPSAVLASIARAFALGESNALPLERLLIPRPEALGGGYTERQFRRSNQPVSTDEGEVIYVIHQMEDVTALVELETARAAAEAAGAAKNQFISSMSHELRTALNPIVGFSQLLAGDRREPLSPRHGERVARIVKGGEHLTRLLDDMLDLSRIELNGLVVSLEPLDVLEVLGEVVDRLAPRAQAGGILLEVLPGTVGVPLVTGDRTRYTQVLENLGTNAIKYNRPGGKVTFGLSWEEDAGTVYVRVTDTGLGIPADKQGRIFQPFERAGREFSAIDGSGIGLALTKRLTELMGGEVGFTSVHGEGSEFWVRIPIHDDRARTSAPPARFPLRRVAVPRG